MFRTFLAIVVIGLGSLAQANVLHVPDQYTTIQAGIDAASSGDTVLVGPGVYVENIDYKGKAIRLRSSGGAEFTTLTGSISINEGEPAGTEFTGFAVRDVVNPSSSLAILEITGNSNVVIANNSFAANQGLTTIVYCSQSTVLIRSNLFHNNVVGSACVGVNDGSVVILNNTFYDNSRGFYSFSNQTIAKNNIVTNSGQYGVFGSYQDLSYNNVWNNSPDYSSATPAQNSLSVDPLFVDPLFDDYHLQEMSPCINAGDPEIAYNDPDGSRADMGCFPKLLTFPAAGYVRVGSATNQRVPESQPLIAWQYLDDPVSEQSAYEVEVGTDPDWTAAELWATGVVESTEESVLYMGGPLVEGSIYSLRIRVRNELAWGGWNEVTFRMNQSPSAPSPISPVMAAQSSPTGTVLLAQNGSDPDGDSLTVEFEVYGDASLTQIVAQRSGIPVSLMTTKSQLVETLEPARFYWWRCRSNDSYEPGPWSPASFFFTTSPQTLRVPEDYITIQGAMDAGEDGDSVLVAPGVYFESLVFGGKDIKVLSTRGATATHLRKPLDDSDFLPQVTFYNGVTREAEFSGFTLRTDTSDICIEVHGSSDPLIHDNVFENLGAVVVFVKSGAPLISRNLFINNQRRCIRTQNPAQSEIINNTFVGNSGGIQSWTGETVALNNIITNSRESGIFGAYKLHDYNNVFGNFQDYAESSPATNEISVDPLFVDAESGDFRLSADSPVIDAGTPDSNFNDPDGSRNDIGYLPYQSITPGTTNIRVGPADRFHVAGSSPTIAWTYIDNGTSVQTEFELEVGSDNDWLTAEMWLPGAIESGDENIVYGGAELIDGTVYFARIRVKNESTWGPWNEFTFRANFQPSVPTLLSPIAGEITPTLDTKLAIGPVTDNDFGPIHVRFEVYSDSLLEELIESISSGPLGYAGTFFSPLLQNIEAGGRYWWRAQSDDGFESSDWSMTASFIARSGISHHVPLGYSKISGAISAARNGDTVMVAPGTYRGRFNYGGKAIVVTSSDGPEVTFLQPELTMIATITAGQPENTELSGFSVSSADLYNAIRIELDASPTIKNMIFVGNYSSASLIQVEQGSAVIRNNLFVANQGGPVVAVSHGTVRIENNTIHANERGVISSSVDATAVNNIVTNSIEYGLWGLFAANNYNNVWQNSPNYGGFANPGADDISQDPKFRVEAAGDFRLKGDSPCIDAGDPDPQFNDPDGSRNDMGAFPYVLVLPNNFALIEPANQLTEPIAGLTPVFNWTESSLPPSEGELLYKLVVAADSQFAFTQVVDSLIVPQASLGYPLEWGTRYWWKVLAISTYGGERWSEEVFTFRTMALGDADGSGQLNISDVVYLINFIFAQGPAPDPLVSGDMNCDGRINIGDAVHLVNYMFLSGPAPCDDFPTMMPAVEFESFKAWPEVSH